MNFNKPPEWGKQFSFPENIQIEYNGCAGSIVSEIAVKMAERYDNAVVEQIAKEAKVAGVAKCVVLNKAAILEALEKRTPQKPIRANRVIQKSGNGYLNDDNEYWKCPVCTQYDVPLLEKQEYCHCCGQAIDWRTNNA